MPKVLERSLMRKSEPKSRFTFLIKSLVIPSGGNWFLAAKSSKETLGTGSIIVCSPSEETVTEESAMSCRMQVVHWSSILTREPCLFALRKRASSGLLNNLSQVLHALIGACM